MVGRDIRIAPALVLRIIMPKSLRSLAAIAAVALLALTGAAYTTRSSSASDHQDTIYLAEQRPGADITDVFVFPAADPSKVVLAMDVWPLIPAGMGSSKQFDPGVLYQLKIAHDRSFVEDQVIQFKADGTGPSQKITVYGPGAPPGGPGVVSSVMSKPIGTATYNKETALGNDVMFFGGPRKDPFYFDLAQFFKIVPDRNFKNQAHPVVPSDTCFRTPGQDFLKPFNVLSLIVELPRKMLANANGDIATVHVWATTSVSEDGSGKYAQIERLSRPAIKEAFEAFKDHDKTNRVAPTNDALLAKYVHDFMVGPAGRSEAIANAAVQVLIPDELTADLSATGPARYLAVETNGKSGLPVGIVRAVPPNGIEGVKRALGDPYRHFGGRDPDSPVIDLSLGAVFGSIIPKVGLAPDDHRESNCLTSDHVHPDNHNTKTFPYIGPPV